WGPAIPNNTAVILSLVVQPDGSYVVYSNGTSVMTGGPNGDFSTSMVPTGTEEYKKYVNVGRNNPDGWSAFNGNIGDVFVYNVALTPTERQQLETDVTAKFLSTDYTVTATPGAGGTINPTGSVSINPGGSQTFTIAPLAGYVLNAVTVDGVPQGVINSYTFSNVTANHTLGATYSAIVLVPTTTLARHPGTGSSSTYGDSLSFDVTCAGTPVPTGTVTLRDGGSNGTIIGSGTLSGGTCTITPALTALTAGSHNNLVAVYAGDGIIPAMNSSALDTQSVSQKTLTVTGLAVTPKPYDGNVTATLTGTPVLNGLVDSDTLTLGNTTSGTFADPNAGTAIPVDTTMTLSGSAATNYSLTKPTLTGTITPRIVTLNGSRAYDGTLTATAGILSASNKIAGDDLALTGSATLAGKNAETQTILLGYATPIRVQSKTGAVGTTAANSFTVSMTAPTSGNTLVAVVSTRSTTASAVTSISNTGTALAWARAVQTTPSSSTTTEIWYAPVLSGAGTDITINLSASIFAAAVVGEYSGVLTPGPVDVTANNSNGSNSTATSTGTTATTTQANEVWIGGIGLRSSGYTLGTPTNSFTAVTNASSGSTTATNNARVYFLEKIVSAAGTANSGGTTTSSRWSGAIATFKAASTSSLALSGTAAGNYTLTGATGSVAVTPKALTVGAPVIASKVYNASATAGAVTVGTLSGFIGTETVTTTAMAAAYSSANAGLYPGTTITYTLSNGINGGLAANYSLSNGTVTGEITRKPLSATAPVIASRVYDATTTAGAVTVGTLSGFVGTETVTASAMAAAYASANAGLYPGTTITYTLSNGINGGLATNYSLSNGTAAGEILPKALTVTGLMAGPAIYDGTLTAKLGGTAVLLAVAAPGTGTPDDGTPYTGDTVILGGTAAGMLAAPYVGTRAVTVTGCTLSGAQADNYSVTQPTGLTQTIMPKALTVSGLAATNKEYDGTPVTNLTGTAALLDAEAAGNGTTSDGKPYTGDSLTLGGTAAGAFANHDAGDGKPVTVTGVTLIGAQADNYSLTQQAGLTANVTPRPLAVAATGPAMAYGMALTTGTSTTNFSAGVAGATGVGSETVTGVTLTPDAAGLSATTAAGSAYVVTPSLATGTGGFAASNYQITYTPYPGTVAKAQATVTLGNLAHAYDGAPKSASATTNPAGLAVDLTYNGFTDPPSAIGSYDVVATVNNSNYTGTASGTLFIAEEAIIAWRKVHFSAQEIADGLAADNIDADGDGAINLIEFAFNGDPRDGASSGMFFTRLADGADGDLTPEPR
ncbi:MAG: YDG domain-containing protein, partial [Verrucomicrobia bacterium]|nr:YDG domain-containing protein [Verrucomicrobiota bacterium]